MNAIPNGRPGAFSTTGFAGPAVTLSGWNPRGTVTIGYPAIAAGVAVNPAGKRAQSVTNVGIAGGFTIGGQQDRVEVELFHDPVDATSLTKVRVCRERGEVRRVYVRVLRRHESLRRMG
jgi:hypothetical protein